MPSSSKQRGVHMNLGMKRGSKLTYRRNIDAVISAEMPHPNKEPVLSDLVKHLNDPRPL